jgi:hypothetical protein
MWNGQGRTEMHTQFWWGKLKERQRLKNLVFYRLYNIKMDLKEMGWKGVAFIYVFQDRVKCRAVVNVVMNLLGSIKCGQYLD